MAKRGMLYLLAGASGSGKSTVAQAVAAADSRLVVLQKGTTRPDRPGEEHPDNRHDPRLKDLRGNNEFLAYCANQELYGVELLKVNAALVAGKSVVMVVNNHLTIDLLRAAFPGRVAVVFLHRDLSLDDVRRIVRERALRGASTPTPGVEFEMKIETESLARWGTRETLYDQLTTGRFTPDFVVINDSVANATRQFQLIVERGRLRTRRKKNRPVLHLILAGTGRDKDTVLRMVETVPGGARYLVPKYTTRPQRNDDGAEMICVDKIPSDCLPYSFFDLEYGVDVEAVKSQIARERVGFLTVAHVPTARAIKAAVEAVGYSVQLWYLHQSAPSLERYPEREHAARAEHYRELLRLYQQEFVTGREDNGVILPMNGETSLSSWVQTRLLEAKVSLFPLRP